ncbi:MAG: Asp-tRNA(Asn)/Glu-tRNA(Gln) amidotransferase subunit GatC [Rhizobiales bacterium]|nr:Asp-tRNA(Asn)/Glu-tRNA(Gln) amidotransferase subunit GatC [Hyphomicrobiales bacterium]
MKIDRDTVHHIARLARLRVSDEEADALVGELSGILSWVEQLGEVDTTGVEPMTRVGQRAMRRREDVVDDGGYPDDVVANAPLKEGHFFAVPKVVE